MLPSGATSATRFTFCFTWSGSTEGATSPSYSASGVSTPIRIRFRPSLSTESSDGVAMQKDAASRFVRDNFEPKDRLAIVIVNKRTASVVQHLASAEQIASPEFQAWLRYQNAQKADIYCTPNVLDNQARGRTKDDIQSIHHIYLDFDHQGTSAVEHLRNHAEYRRRTTS